MAVIGTTAHHESPRSVPSSLPLIRDWAAFIRAMEARCMAPVRHTPSEVAAVATWTASFGLQHPALPAADHEAQGVRDRVFQMN